MPRVVQTSMPIPLTSLTIVKILSNPRFLPARSHQAAPMQNLVLPFALAFRSASRTGSMSTKRDAFVGVEYLEDCEQYEPTHGVNYKMTLLTIFTQTYNLRYILRLAYADRYT